MFTTSQGGPLRASNFRRDVFFPGSHRAGLEGSYRTGCGTAASLAIAAGAIVKVVQQMLGHNSATMTLDLYGHLFDNRLDDVADALDAGAARSAKLKVKQSQVVLLDERDGTSTPRQH